MNLIDYSLLGRVSESYRRLGFVRVESPWWVTKEILDITKPPFVETEDYMIGANKKCLVASGEQSLLYLINKGQLPPGKYQTITPCFRNEPFDPYHSKYFMKLELMNLLGPEDKYNICLEDMLDTIRDTLFFLIRGHASLDETDQYKYDPTIVPGTKTYDLNVRVGDSIVELGSYGVRHCDFATWVYGTGIAEPRFSKVNARLDFLR